MFTRVFADVVLFDVVLSLSEEFAVDCVRLDMTCDSLSKCIADLELTLSSLLLNDIIFLSTDYFLFFPSKE